MNDTAQTIGTAGPAFLSYASSDREVATKLAEGLRAAGVDVWQDVGRIRWGDEWLERLQEVLASCSAYVLVVGSAGARRWVRMELGVALNRHVEEKLPVLVALLPGTCVEDLPPFLRLFQTLSLPTAVETLDFAALAGSITEAVAARGRLPEGLAVEVDTCPFPGLEPFDEDSARFFHGRQGETLELLERIGQTREGVYRRWLQIDGPSGVGKSSLVRAGLIPALRRGWVDQDEGHALHGWHIAVMRPGANAVESLAAALKRTLTPEGGPSLASLVAALREGDAAALRYLVREHLGERDNFLLVVDQLEEVFTLGGEDSVTQQRFDALLADALRERRSPFHLVTTIRSDFMMRFGALPQLETLLNDTAERYFLRPIGAPGLRAVVRTPARLVGLRWSDKALPRDIVDEAAPEKGSLPLVGNLLHLMWERQRQRGDGMLRRDDYRTGGVGGALARSADALLDSLGEDGRERARRLLLSLVQLGRESEDTRRTVTLATALKAAGGGPEAEQILDRLAGRPDPDAPASAAATPRLVVVSKGSGMEAARDTHLVDLAHEALLRLDRAGKPYWGTLRSWIDADREFLLAHERLDIQARQWVEEACPEDRLLPSGRPLDEARALLEERRERLDEDLVHFIESSIDAQRRARRRRVVMWAGVGVVFFATLGGLAAMNVSVEHRSLSWRVVLLWPRVMVAKLSVGSTLRRWLLPLPEMLEIPGGSFKMGCLEEKGCSREELPVRSVDVPRFRIGKYEVTFNQYDAYVLWEHGLFAAKEKFPSDSTFGRGSRPVINVSWNDATAYANWLFERTGQRYRLPSESEWEYAARAGMETRFWWGGEVREGDKTWANCGDCGSEWDSKQTAPVGSFAANAWGLHDTAGNVLEWVQDCWHKSHENAPDDGRALGEEDGADCSGRVTRGGSYHYSPGEVRSSYRIGYLRFGSGPALGFRLAQDL